MNNEMLQEVSWSELRNNGLILFVNQFLQIFGYSIVFDVQKETGMVTRVYPCRTRFRGFDNKMVADAYRKLGNWLPENAEALKEEANS